MITMNIFGVLFVLLVCSSAYRLFLIGGNTNSQSTLVYQTLANAVPNRVPQPSKCSSDWSSTNCPKIAVTTSAASSTQDGNYFYTFDDELGLSYQNLFNLYGMSPKHISLHRDNYRVHGNISTPEGAANLQLLMQADIVFFNGGDQMFHSRSWLNDDGSYGGLMAALQKRAVNNEVILAGTSAGSMVWGPRMVSGGDPFGTLYFENSVGLAPKQVKDAQVGDQASKDDREGNSSLQYFHNTAKMSAFGFVNWFADSHFNARGRLGRLPPILKDLKLQIGVGIDEKTALFYESNGLSQVVGYNGVTICDMGKAILPTTSYFSVKNIRVHYLTAGDTYDFLTKRVTSCKEVITTPQYSGPTDSSDILKEYEASLLLTRTVDQKALYNLGKTQTPSDFPKNTPVFELKFQRDSSTKGYYTDKMYTVDGAVLEFSYGSNFVGHLISE